MIASEDSGPRADPTLPLSERNVAQNLILLCPTHHTLVDKYPFQYNVDVLRAMKRVHEESVAIALSGNSGNPLTLHSDEVHLSVLPIVGLPNYVFSAPTPYRKDNILDLFDAVDAENHRELVYAFELRDKRIHTFFDLRSAENPFRGAYETDGVRITTREELIASPDGKRLYVALLNRALRSLLKKKGVGFDGPPHNRFFFEPDKLSIRRQFSYTSLAGKKTTRSVVWNPVTKATDTAKPYWVHLGAALSFQQVSRLEWVLAIRPGRHLTTDGREPYNSQLVGRKITRMKSTIYNWQYLQEVQLWREFLCSASPRLVIAFERQAIVMENRLPSPEVHWPGIPDDVKDFATQLHEEDLFSTAEIDSLLEDSEQLEADLDEHVFIYDEGDAK